MNAVLEKTAPVRDRAWHFERLMDNWTRWMNSDERPAGLPEQACGGIAGYVSGGYDHGESYELMDCQLAEATNAAIDGLLPQEQAIIYREYGVIAVMRWNRTTDILERAKAKVAESLERRGVVIG